MNKIIFFLNFGVASLLVDAFSFPAGTGVQPGAPDVFSGPQRMWLREQRPVEMPPLEFPENTCGE